MKLVRYEYPETSWKSDFEDLFNSTLSGFDRWPKLFERWPHLLEEMPGMMPEMQLAADMYDDDNNYYIKMELPGFKKEEINIELENTVLNVKAERKKKMDNSERSMFFTRSLSLPEGVASDKISAKTDNGVLTITLPKTEQRKAKTITIS